jgi:predicted RNA-binding Zn ribbon-like protein
MQYTGYAVRAPSTNGRVAAAANGGPVPDEIEKPWPGFGMGGAPALDFANTLDWRLRREPIELLRGYADLARWGRSAGALTAAEARALGAWARRHPRAAAAALAAAVALREAVADGFAALVHGRAVPRRTLEAIASACRESWRARELRAEGEGAGWAWAPGEPSPARPAWAAALDAARLLTSDARTHVRQCADEQCGWFFLDTSRNGSRRWCSMKGCGNRNKARRFRRRTSGAPGRKPART